MTRLLILIGTVFFLGVSKTQAQIGIAIAKQKGSAVEWRISWGNGDAWDCKMAAKKYLQKKGYSNVATQDCNTKCGHSISSGYYVVVKARHKIYDGSYKTSYGLGASTSSYSDAKTKAVKNLSIYDWSWKKSDGVSVEKQGTY